MEKALREIKSSGFSGKRFRVTETKSDLAAYCSFQKRKAPTRSQAFRATSKKCSSKKSCLKVKGSLLFRQNASYLKRKLFPPVFKALCIRMISFYQRRLSRHTCLYEPTCSEYTKRCINNLGTLPGILLGIWRILRCNPFSKGGYDPAPENPLLKKWLL